MSFSTRIAKTKKAQQAKKAKIVNALRSQGLRGNGLPGAVLATRGFGAGFGRSLGELKAVDLAPFNYGCNDTGAVTLLNGTQRGADINQRNGRKIRVKKLFIRGRVTLENQTLASTDTPPGQARVIVVIDWQQNGGSLPGITDILDTLDPTSQLKLANRDRFKVLSDKTFEFDGMRAASGTLGINRVVAKYKWHKRLNVDVTYDDSNNGDHTDIVTGAIYLVTLGNWAAGTNTDCFARLSSRCRFEDQ